MEPNLLGLDEQSLAWRRAICEMASLLGKATLIGNAPPMVERISKRLRAPEVGDYVFEVTTFRRRRFEDGSPIHAEGSGYLRRITNEPVWTDEVWAEEHAADPTLVRPTERAYYVQYGPDSGDECRWTNAEFQVVPLDQSIFDEVPAYTVNPDGSRTFTRDSLVGSLADAGFHLRPR